MFAKPRVEPVHQCVAADSGSFAESDKCARAFTAIWIGHTDDQRFLDRRMLNEHRFDLAGKDLEPTNRNHILDPVDDPGIALRIEHRDIPGAQPALAITNGERLGGCIRPLPVALHHLRSANRKLARLPLRRIARRILLVEQAQAGCRKRLADRAGPVIALIGIGRGNPG